MRGPRLPDIFLDAVQQVDAANKDYIPPEGKVRAALRWAHGDAHCALTRAFVMPQGSLYIRPLLIGSGPILGLAPAPEYTFVIYASPVASYFKACASGKRPRRRPARI